MHSTVIGVFTDDKIDGVLFERAFDQYDHRIEGYVFDNPERGILAAREVGFDVVFIEIHFWGEDFGGVSILDQLRKASPRKLLAVALTSFLQDGDLERILKSGFTMCIEKPLSLDLLKSFVTRKTEQLLAS